MSRPRRATWEPTPGHRHIVVLVVVTVLLMVALSPLVGLLVVREVLAVAP